MDVEDAAVQLEQDVLSKAAEAKDPGTGQARNKRLGGAGGGARVRNLNGQDAPPGDVRV
jgi:hypothetical protein